MKKFVKRRKQVYLFLDFETTGLNFDSRGNILDNQYIEVAGFFKEKLFGKNRVNQFSFVRKVDNVENLINSMNKSVYGMHFRSGLLSELQEKNENGTALSNKEIEKYLLDIVEDYYDKGYTVKVVGNSIEFDFELIRRFMPNLYERLDGRPLNVSVFAQLIRAIDTDAYKKAMEFKTWEHRAIDDIIETDVELMRYRDLIDLSSLGV